MKSFILFIQIALLSVSLHSNVNDIQPASILNKDWVLYKIRNPHSRTDFFVDEYHYLRFENGVASFKIDCNTCSIPYEFISRDSIYFHGYPSCTRKGCIENDKIKITYSGICKIWMEGSYLLIETNAGVHIYK